MGDEEERDAPPRARVELGECFLEEETARCGFWAFGRGKDVLLTGLSTEEAFLLVVHLRGKAPR
jgi:hypothetical protein